MDAELYISGWSNEKFLNVIEALLVTEITSDRPLRNARLIESVNKTMNRLRESFTNKVVSINPVFQAELVDVLDVADSMFNYDEPNQLYYEIGLDCEAKTILIVKHTVDQCCIQIHITKTSIQVFYTETKIIINGYYPTKRLVLGRGIYKVDVGGIRELYGGDPMEILYEANPTNYVIGGLVM